MPSIMRGNAPGDICFTESTVLSRSYRRGKPVRPEAGVRVSRHCPELPEHMVRKDVRVRDLAESFTAVAILTLTRELLQKLIRNHQFRSAIIRVQSRVIRRGPLPVKGQGKTAPASPVREVFLNGRI